MEFERDGMGRIIPLRLLRLLEHLRCQNMLEDPDYDIAAGEDLNGNVLCDVKGDYKEG